MASFATDFHATLDEIIELTGKWMAEYPIFATAHAFPPSRTVSVPLRNFREILTQPAVCAVLFTTCPVDPSARDNVEILRQHPGALNLHIERIGLSGLPQSALTTMDANPMWKKMNRELKKLTTAGATLICENGLTPYDRNARFTAGAKALAAAGTPLRQFAQSTDFKYLPK